MDAADKLTLILVIADVIVIVLAGLVGFLVDLALPGRRWTRWRVSARSAGLLYVCVVGIVGMVLLPMSIAIGVPATFVAVAGMGPWVLALAGAVCFTISRKVDRTAERRPPFAH